MAEGKEYDKKAMDEAANDFSLEWYKIKEKHPEITTEISNLLNEWYMKAGWKRIAKVIANRWG